MAGSTHSCAACFFLKLNEIKLVPYVVFQLVTRSWLLLD